MGSSPWVFKPADGDGKLALSSGTLARRKRRRALRRWVITGTPLSINNPSTTLQLPHPHSQNNYPSSLTPQSLPLFIHSQPSLKISILNTPSLIKAFCSTVFGRRTGRIFHRPGMFGLLPEFCGMPPPRPFPLQPQKKRERKRSVSPAALVYGLILRKSIPKLPFVGLII